MSESSFPTPVEEVLATAIEIFKHQGKSEVVELLENSRGYFDETEYDNWNGGTYTWALRLDVPVQIFASIEPRLHVIEKEISQKLSYLERLHTNDRLGAVTITPVANIAASVGLRPVPSDAEAERIWPKGHFRLFLSHIAIHKEQVSQLKMQLGLFGIAGFVAHEDIEPTREWRDEIELGLCSMHALAAVITPEFDRSDWTDQEIGWALGRGVPVIPLRIGANPYGFAGKYQAITGGLDDPIPISIAILQTLVANRMTHGEMRRCLVNAFCNSKSYSTSLSLVDVIEPLNDFTEIEIANMRKACVENKQVREAYKVSKRISEKFGKLDPPQETRDDDIPF